jgi:RsiW-degrading membrane proteinase PrsW (M82 family)
MTLLALPYAVIPMVLFMFIVRRLDRYDPEPLWLLLTHFFWGAIGAVSISAVANAKLIAFFWGKAALEGDPPKLAAVFIGPMVEELIKATIFILTVRLRDFNNLTDGIVYGATVGFGFAMTENLVYFIRAANIDNLAQFIAYRTFFSGMMHALSCGIFAAFLGYAQFRFGRVPWIFVVFGIVPAVILHMGFNFFVSTPSVNALGFVLIVIAFSGLCFTFAQSLRFEQKFIREELVKEAEAGLIPKEYVELPFKKKQTKIEYIKARLCVQIAFERISSRHLREQWQLDQSKTILSEMHKRLNSLPV